MNNLFYILVFLLSLVICATYCLCLLVVAVCIVAVALAVIYGVCHTILEFSRIVSKRKEKCE